jgi:HlyD family secretion protein
MKRLKPLLVLLIILGGGGAAYYYFNLPPTSLVLTGIVTTNEVIIGPQIGGRLGEVLVKEGDQVKQGQLLAVIAPDELKAETAYAMHNVENVTSQIQQARADMRYEQQHMTEQIRQAESTLAAAEAQQAAAQADLEAARLSFQRVQNLSREGVAAAQELDQARTSFEAAQARVDALRKQVDAQRGAIAVARTSAEQVEKRRNEVQGSEHMQAAASAQVTKAEVRLSYTEMKAPIDGIVDVRAARTGEVVNAGQPVVTLINPDDLWIRADLEETYIDRVKIGDHMKVRLPSGAEIDGVVFYRGLDAGFATQRDVSRTKRDIKTFEIRLRADNTDRKLAVGMTAQVLLPLQ